MIGRDLAELEGVERETIQILFRAGEEGPASGVGLVAFGVSGEDFGGVVVGVDGEGDESGFGGKGFRELFHAGGHAEAGSGAAGEDEVGDPDAALKAIAREAFSALIGEGEGGNGLVDGERGFAASAGGGEESEAEQESLHDDQSAAIR